MQFSPELRDDVASGDVTVSFRLWRRPKVRVGGSVLTDNATTHRDELSDFVAQVRGRSDASSTEIPVGNGLEWTVKVQK